MIYIVLGLMLIQTPQIGSSLSDTVQLVYESGGIRQAPWIYESVRVTGDVAYDRCVAVARRAQAERETCVRGDTLFERNAVGTRVPVRPVGPNMRLEVATPAGNLMEYTTGAFATRSVAGATNISVIATTIVTRDSTGTILRRLREDYAPSLLTAVWGIFEVPDGIGGWRTDREFSLHEVRYVRSEKSRDAVVRACANGLEAHALHEPAHFVLCALVVGCVENPDLTFGIARWPIRQDPGEHRSLTHSGPELPT